MYRIKINQRKPEQLNYYQKKIDFKATVLLDIFKIKTLFIVTKGSIQQEHIKIILNLYAPNNSNVKKKNQAKTIRATRKNKSTISNRQKRQTKKSVETEKT